MPAALERGGGAVPLSVAKAVTHASEKTRVAEALAQGLANAFSHPIAEALADPEIFADSEIIPHPEVLANPEILPDPQVFAHPQTYSGAET